VNRDLYSLLLWLLSLVVVGVDGNR